MYFFLVVFFDGLRCFNLFFSNALDGKNGYSLSDLAICGTHAPHQQFDAPTIRRVCYGELALYEAVDSRLKVRPRLTRDDLSDIACLPFY